MKITNLLLVGIFAALIGLLVSSRFPPQPLTEYWQYKELPFTKNKFAAGDEFETFPGVGLSGLSYEGWDAYAVYIDPRTHESSILLKRRAWKPPQ